MKFTKDDGAKLLNVLIWCFIGSMLAPKMGIFWPLGSIAGGIFGYFTTDIKKTVTSFKQARLEAKKQKTQINPFIKQKKKKTFQKIIFMFILVGILNALVALGLYQIPNLNEQLKALIIIYGACALYISFAASATLIGEADKAANGNIYYTFDEVHNNIEYILLRFNPLSMFGYLVATPLFIFAIIFNLSLSFCRKILPRLVKKAIWIAKRTTVLAYTNKAILSGISIAIGITCGILSHFPTVGMAVGGLFFILGLLAEKSSFLIPEGQKI